MSVNESQIKNTTAGAIDDDDAVIFKERKRLLFLGLPWTFTKYTVTPSFITVESGLLSTTEDDCYMYKVADVKLTTSLMERIFTGSDGNQSIFEIPILTDLIFPKRQLLIGNRNMFI